MPVRLIGTIDNWNHTNFAVIMPVAMARLHICNTFFEQELGCKAALHLKKWFVAHPAIFQLQYLPLLFAEPEDRILVSSLHSNPDSRLCLIDGKMPLLPISAWGASQAIEGFAKDRGLRFQSPPVSLVRQIQSKDFAFALRPHLCGSALLSTPEETIRWIEKTSGPKVLKRVLGFAGQGHFFIGKSQNIDAFIKREFAEGRPIVAEPWLPRKLDFSSQWEIGDRIELQGLTTFETSERGSYSATLVGPSSQLFGKYEWAIDQHLAIAQPILEKIQAMGFFGSLGIDAFIYGDDQLHPIVEINARKTMGRIALMIQQQRAPDRLLRMSFENKPGGLLPGPYSRNIFIS